MPGRRAAARRLSLPAVRRYGQSVSKKHWVDPEGLSWRLRGEQYRDLGRHKIEKMLRDPNVRVVITNYETVKELPFAEREQFWSKARPYYLELPDRDATSDMTHFAFEEYVSAGHQHLLLVQESC